MSETKNDQGVATQFANKMIGPAVSPYSVGSASISDSNGQAAQDITKIISQTASVMSTFETSITADAKNILSISAALEKADQEAKKVVGNGK
ncbi:DUF3130 family protein [uncultured Vagococcus sp.]|uniref:DUF3130 family protein n=1 Tax=uncultured Vagococcus sp. TaxID=189676 RepID=UPI0028D689C4|nr:DUF3130 family protein [uncultured Vagococcus sp.]